MKKTELRKKLRLNKSTVASLNTNQQKAILGGASGPTSCMVTCKDTCNSCIPRCQYSIKCP